MKDYWNALEPEDVIANIQIGEQRRQLVYNTLTRAYPSNALVLTVEIVTNNSIKSGNRAPGFYFSHRTFAEYFGDVVVVGIEHLLASDTLRLHRLPERASVTLIINTVTFR